MMEFWAVVVSGMILLLIVGVYKSYQERKANNKALQILLDNLDKWEGTVKDVPKNEDIS